MVRGGLAEIKAVTMGLSEPREKVRRKQSVAAALFDRVLPLIPRMARASAYDVPRHNPRITRVYSVSFPVWAA